METKSREKVSRIDNQLLPGYFFTSRKESRYHFNTRTERPFRKVAANASACSGVVKSIKKLPVRNRTGYGNL